MYPKLICKDYECKLGSGVEVRVLGIAEGEATLPDEFIAIILAPDKVPEQLQADTFDGVVTKLAKALDETENTVRTALAASVAKRGRSQAVKPDNSFLGSMRRRIGMARR